MEITKDKRLAMLNGRPDKITARLIKMREDGEWAKKVLDLHGKNGLSMPEALITAMERG
ncbi:MAG TPA: hypothetical protein VJ327_04955 [Patescibacteria group bacterium]|nr:hypothetical protein [Patescibacteria group bacterium]